MNVAVLIQILNRSDARIHAIEHAGLNQQHVCVYIE